MIDYFQFDKKCIDCGVCGRRVTMANFFFLSPAVAVNIWNRLIGCTILLNTSSRRKTDRYASALIIFVIEALTAQATRRKKVARSSYIPCWCNSFDESMGLIPYCS